MRFTCLLETLRQGAMLLDARGRVVYKNAALRALCGTPGAGGLEVACARAGLAMLARAASCRRSRSMSIGEPQDQEILTGAGRFLVRCTFLGAGTIGRSSVVLVIVDRAEAEPLCAAELHRRFQLTKQEIVVSQLLARGHSNSEVARELGISIHTARRHAERVLMKLGVHSRARVAAKLVLH